MDSIRFNFVDYLKDAKSGILHTVKHSSKWSSHYEYDTYTLMNDSKSNCTDNTKENDHQQQLNQQRSIAKRPSPELDYDPEEFLLNLDLFNSSFNESAPKSSRSTANLFAKEQHFDETESDEEEDDDYDENDDEDDLSSVNDRDSLRSGSSKANKSRKRIKKILPQQTTTDELFDSSMQSHNNVDSLKKKKVIHADSTSSVKKAMASNKKKELSVEEALKRDKKRERRQKRRDRAADFYVLSFDNELTETSSSESDSSSKNEINNSTANSMHCDFLTLSNVRRE